ncbi:hypothetical protein GUITHDRAFT_118730 [Guillardia theta CCMP2712]|uniref:CENP-V/GFA domain-containing protein n=1 Tax=Guillardia theta (strain CCMP2712) TaxID=905079 RepID=L1IGM4_GUITC|nr:hypothetical protein GUITHDRAFT_118730 [Guillardia theta CCMP2712]EKX35074.1 hypothetical protein GUITHDRAFT_118730 [Guillardia theta CCMP2712]|mmetsp:Transcript_329/g.697  ORF Transcript_329/g.697 Transcript_329/m.697 type:complete len:126 (-) Transcript_329:54-431(-)|eukprot:XP_005822054.1 hypothetical protein GUITHDRAFT_118730 [Guillardia theta CCMP2712]
MSSYSCICGKVKVEYSGNPMFVAYCHCVECRKTCAAPYFHGSGFPKDNVKIVNGESTGSFAAKQMPRHFCKDCGTYVYGNAGEFYVLPCGLMDKPPAAQFHIWTSEKAIPVLPEDGLPRFEQGPK